MVGVAGIPKLAIEGRGVLPFVLVLYFRTDTYYVLFFLVDNKLGPNI
jgi:hypothetical protein